MNPVRTLASILLLLSAVHSGSGVAEENSLSAEQLKFFESKIRPLLIEHCYECHSHDSGESEGSLYLDSAKSVRKGGSLGPAIVPGNPDASLLVRAIRYDDASMQMPPSEKLDAESIKLLEHWVAIGAPDPRIEDRDNHTDSSVDPSVTASSHWAFQLPQRFVGETSRDESDRDLIDSIARHSAMDVGLTIASPADDATLVRRLYHDLTGLPATSEQIAAFVDSQREDKLDRLVDRLLASPEYAERFARHWMDVARYADTVGYAFGGQERRLIGSERYRDWLINAFARDMPFDEMIRLQLAADRFDPNNEQGNLDAMGFLTIGRRYINHFDTIDDRIDVITRGLMGMTVACARCHDHKFDPIPTKDYYALVGVFESSMMKPDGPSPLMMVDKEKPHDTHVFLRGQPGSRGEIAPRQYLTALRGPDDPRFSDGSGRLELAQRIASSDNPLVARVFVNRIWTHLIGRPFVDSLSDFGIRTEKPELHALFDELSADFSQHWSVKRLVRRIVTSRLYAQSSNTEASNTEASDEAVDQLDPENRLAARGNLKRKSFEAMRDSLLVVCGRLERRTGGAPVDVHLATPVNRRTVYAKIDRQNLPSLFRTFDFASPDAHTPRRATTTVPQQALFLLNHPQIGTLTRELADRIGRTTSTSEEQVVNAFQAVLARDPEPSELSVGLAFLAQDARDREVEFDPKRAWSYGTTPVTEGGAVKDFLPFEHFSGADWQTDAKLPAPNEYGYAFLGAKNGHPGNKHAVVRRWTAPADGRVTVSGVLGHSNKQGDGIEFAIWIGGKRVWKHNQKGNDRPFKGIRGTVKAGEFVDLVASPRDNASYDTFFLQSKLRLRTEDRLYKSDSVADFSGPLGDAAGGLDRLAQFVQALLLSNEFLFVD